MKANTPNVAPETKLHAILFLQMIGVKVATVNPRINDIARDFASGNSCIRMLQALNIILSFYVLRSNTRRSEAS